MLNFLKKLLMFRVGQKSGRGAARALGLRRLALPVGLVTGYKYMRRHS